jgi:hypothetical protein
VHLQLADCVENDVEQRFSANVEVLASPLWSLLNGAAISVEQRYEKVYLNLKQGRCCNSINVHQSL